MSLKAKSLMKAMGTESTTYSTSAPSSIGDGRLKRKFKAAVNQRNIKKVMEKKAEANKEMSSENGATTDSKPKANSSSTSGEVGEKYTKPVKYKIGLMKDNFKAKMEDMQGKALDRRANRAKKQSGSDDINLCGSKGCKMGKPQPGLSSNWKGQ